MLTAEQYNRGWGGPIAILAAIAAFKIAIAAWQWWQARHADTDNDAPDGDVLADEDPGEGEPRPARWWERALDRAGIWAHQDREPLPSPTGEWGHDPNDPGDDPGVTGDEPTENTRVPVVVYREGAALLGPEAQRRAALPGWVAAQLRLPAGKRLGHNEIVREGARIHGVSPTTVKRAIADARGRTRR